MDLKQFAASMKMMGEMLPGKPNLENPAVLQFWYDEFGSMHDDDLKKGFRLALSTLDRFPVIAKFKEIVGGVTETRDQTAVHIAGKVWESLGKFGQYNPSGAEKWLGAEGWEVVKLMGGWFDVCSIEDMSYRGTFVAQARGFANAILAREGINDRGHKMISCESETSKFASELAGKTLTLA